MALALAFNAAATSSLSAQRVREDPKPSRYAELAIDERTGKVLYEHNAQHSVYPASTTKLMTAYLTFQAMKDGKLHLDDMLKISPYAASMPTTNLWFTEETVTRTFTKNAHGKRIAHIQKGPRKQVVFEIKAETALRGMLCHSANDAAVVFAEAVGGNVDDFVAEMNAQAKRLGMTNTHFANPNGLPNVTNKTTVEDMAKLARALIEDFPEYYKYFSIPSITYNGNFAKNTNHLLGVDPDVDGMKTGWIEMSGFNLIASAKRGDTRVIAIVFGATSSAVRNQDVEHLLTFSFEKEKNPDARFAYGHAPAANQPVRYVQATPKEQHAPPAPPALAASPPPPPKDATPKLVVSPSKPA